MKALTLWQPWASLMALGLKRIETRGWSTPHRGPLAIHASSRLSGPVGSRLEFPGIVAERVKGGMLLRRDGHPPLELPLGAVVAIVSVYDVLPTDSPRLHPDRDLPFGDYTPGRWAWQTANLDPLPDPVPVAGHQQLWEWTPPPGLLEGLRYSYAEPAGSLW